MKSRLILALLVGSFALTANADTFTCSGRTRQKGLNLTINVKASYDTTWGDGRNVRTFILSEGTKTDTDKTLLTRTGGKDIQTGKQGKDNTTIYTDPTGAEVRHINEKLGTSLLDVKAAVLDLDWEPNEKLEDGAPVAGLFYFEIGADREQALVTKLNCTWNKTK